MTKPLKILGLVLSLTGLLTLAYLAASSYLVLYPEAASPWFKWLEGLPSWADQILRHYLLWTSLFLMGLVLVLSLVLIFGKNAYQTLTYQGSSQGLAIKASALEAYVKTLAAEENLMTNPQAKVKIYKKKIKAEVKGEWLPTRNLAQEIQDLQAKLERDLKAFFGLDHQLALRVKVAAIQPRAKQRAKSRVE